MRHTRQLFFALKPDAATRKNIQEIQRCIPQGQGRRVPIERLHATLLFLGNQSEQQFERLKDIAGDLSFPRCSVRLDRCGHFPRAAIVWLGSDSVPPELCDFQDQLRQAIDSAGIEFDTRPWRLHVTLYRNLRMRPETITFEPVEWPLLNFQLMESVHEKSGLKYLRRGHWSV